MVTRPLAIIVVWLSVIAGGGSVALAATEPEPTPPPSTFNVFYPEERPLTDCLNNSIPLPNCGSEARGGWAQTTVFVAILAALGFIGWRISRIVRQNRRALDASSARDAVGGGRAP